MARADLNRQGRASMAVEPFLCTACKKKDHIGCIDLKRAVVKLEGRVCACPNKMHKLHSTS